MKNYVGKMWVKGRLICLCGTRSAGNWAEFMEIIEYDCIYVNPLMMGWAYNLESSRGI